MSITGRATGPQRGRNLGEEKATSVSSAESVDEQAIADTAAPTTQPGQASERQSRREAKESTSSTPTRKPPAGTPIPTMGLRAVHYQLNVFFKHPESVPPLSKKEQRLLDTRRKLAAKAQQEEEWKTWINLACNSSNAVVDGQELTWSDIRGIVSLHDHKGGGGKTSIAAPAAGMLARITNQLVLLLPFGNNSGTSHVKAGVDSSNTLTLYGLYLFLKERTKSGETQVSAAEVLTRLHRNGEGVYVVAQQAPPNGFGGEELRWMVTILREIFPIIFLDGGNAIARVSETEDMTQKAGGNLEYGAGKISDLLVFTCSTRMPDSPDAMGESMDAFSVLRDKSKLARSIVAVAGHREGVDSEQQWVTFAENKITRRAGKAVAVGPRDIPIRVAPRVDGEIPLAKLILIPYDKHMKESAAPVLNELAPETYSAYLELLYEMVRRIGEQQKRDFTVLDRIRKAQHDAIQYDPSQTPYYTDNDFETDSEDNPSSEQGSLALRTEGE